MLYEVTLTNVGRQNHSLTKIFEASSLENVAEQAVNECKKYLVSDNVGLCQSDTDETLFTVFAGFHTVGKVQIKKYDIKQEIDSLKGDKK